MIFPPPVGGSGGSVWSSIKLFQDYGLDIELGPTLLIGDDQLVFEG
jgi:hypothetical protein